MPTPLQGIRVVDWTVWQRGPVSTNGLLGYSWQEVGALRDRQLI
jgi:hypothetical protein